MSWDDATIAAAAAILSSALTGYITWRGTKSTLEHDSDSLAATLRAERFAASEDRNQERRKEAYAQLMKYVYWTRDLNGIRQSVMSRSVAAAERARTAVDKTRTVETLQSEQKAFLAVVPTKEEQHVLDAGPSSKEYSETLAIVTAVASDEIFEAFKRLELLSVEFSDKVTALGTAALRYPTPDVSMDEVARATFILGNYVPYLEKYIEASEQAKVAKKRLDCEVNGVITQVRQELNNPPQSIQGNREREEPGSFLMRLLPKRDRPNSRPSAPHADPEPAG